MTKLRSTSIALFLAVATFALGACGDDKGSNESATTGADTTAAGTTETGTTKKRTGTGKTETGKRKRDDKGGSGGGSDDSSGSGSGGKSGSGSSPEKELSGKNVYSTSKTVCNSFLPTALEQDLKSGDKSAEDIAKDYSKGYPAEERKRAHDGCLAGLKGKG